MVIVSLNSEQKRYQYAQIATRRSRSFDLTQAKSRLKEIRRYTLDNIDLLEQQFLKALSKLPNVHTFCAPDAEEASLYVARVAGKRKAIAVNRASTVHELRQPLEQQGYTMVETYHNQFDQSRLVQKELQHYWELPLVSQEFAWQAFAIESNASIQKQSEENRKDYVALLGASATAAEDGSIYFLQHSSNIGTAMEEAGTLILVVGIDKIVRSRDDALFQTKCMGIFGMESLLLDLKAADRQNKVALENTDRIRHPAEIHVIILDNRRRFVQGSDFKELLTCIGCRACRMRCPTHDFYGISPNNYPRQYLWTFLSGTEKSLDLCIGCGMCYATCPLDINMPRLMSVAREKQLPKFAHLSKNGILSNVWLLMRVASLFSPLVNFVLHSKLIRIMLQKMGLEVSPEVLNSLDVHSQTFEKIHNASEDKG